jgi:hypothetical protein
MDEELRARRGMAVSCPGCKPSTFAHRGGSLHSPKKQQKVPTVAPPKKDVISYEQSHYIHENKQNKDKMPQ